ncbi:ABC transporter ATP-binding protein [Devosia sp. 63-57]|uniref:ABC transporter ATP-binding protein n=1 Tax=Devosia sp. 63-57 TaxID=1895751 RepID=UPI0008698CCE|nr:ABC transporter ATP-binding protein [Devosia sp. 63-57]ODT50839.1 MAG: microcin ABC transporter ATP-binding protein [Pelagibacterium sp. SCN 63-126]ODU86776.1 MAG: microcin ABC transporter ATP-binding protein [Pelagibacterium sp. SCN 63-17]OJX44499.1 MAG: microcin ABC transporter ATP-binding protein [Devosia sp. 63-57]
MTAPLLSVRDLTIGFGASPAARSVSFDISPGETVALVGESGSGKSVTALSVLKLLPPSATLSGSIRLDGTELVGADDATLRQVRGNRVGMIFQEPMSSLNPLHSIGKQIGETLAVHQGLRKTAARKRTLELLDAVGIPDPLHRFDDFPHQLSGGQRQRVMIAMALANDPKLLIADEPTTALDVTVQAQILALLKKLQRDNGMAMLFITHDLTIVRRIADRVCVMTGGEIVESGPVNAIFDKPQHDYTKRLLAAAPRGDALVPAPDAPTVVEATDLKVWFPIKRGLLRRVVGHIRAVDGVDLTIKKGETLGVVGESGSGKSSLGYAMLRLIPSEGRIVVLGNAVQARSWRSLRPLRKHMQIVFQDPYGSLSPRMSVREIVEEGLGVHMPQLGRAEREAKMTAALREVGLDPAVASRYPHEFSGGQRQRIAIARALVLEPDFLVLDEPTSALDVSIQAQVIDLLRDVQHRRQLSYLFISHDLRVVRALAHRLIVMRHGKVVEQGLAADIFAAPQQDYTRQLLAAAFDLASPETVNGTTIAPDADI